MPLKLTVDIFIIQLSQVVREPFIFDCHEAEEGTFARSLTAYETQHILKLAPGLKYPFDRAHHK